MTYKLVNLEQGSPEWVEYRKSRIGGSDAATIMGENPYSSPEKLMQEKMGIKKVFVNDAMKRGTKLEPDARLMFERIYNLIIEPAVAVDIEYPFLMASLDGFNNDMILEIKCPGEKMHLNAKSNGIPPHYYAQLQHAMMITDRKTALFMSYRDDEDFFFYTCDRDENYIEKLRIKELEFYTWMQKGLILNGSEPVKDIEETISDEQAELLSLYKTAKKKSAIWDQTCKDLKEEIIASLNRPLKYNGVSLIERTLPGRIDYGNIPELQNVDLDKYRKPETKSWVLSTYE